MESPHRRLDIPRIIEYTGVWGSQFGTEDFFMSLPYLSGKASTSVAFLSLIALWLIAGCAGDLKAQNEGLRKEVAELTAENDKLKGEVNRLRTDSSGLHNQIAELNLQISTLYSQNQTLQNQIDALKEKGKGKKK
jgi:outer membrane murein-binding lipoprotein Lpp